MKAVVVYKGKFTCGDANVKDKFVYSWDDFMALGEGDSYSAELQKRIEAIKPGHCSKCRKKYNRYCKTDSCARYSHIHQRYHWKPQSRDGEP